MGSETSTGSLAGCLRWCRNGKWSSTASSYQTSLSLHAISTWCPEKADAHNSDQMSQSSRVSDAIHYRYTRPSSLVETECNRPEFSPEFSHQSTQLLANTQSTLVPRQKNQKQTKNFLNWVQTHKRTQRTLFIMTKYNHQISGVIPFIKLQIDT